MKESVPALKEKNTTRIKLGIWAGVITSIFYLVFFVFSIFVVIRQGYFFWTDTLFVVLTGIASISGYISASLMRREQHILGSILLYFVNILVPVAAAISLRDISLLSSTYIFIISTFLYLGVVPIENREWILWGSGFSIAISTLADAANPSFQASTDNVESLIPLALGTITLALIVLLVWQAGRSNIRVKLLFSIFLIIGTVVFFQTGVNLRISRELHEETEKEKLLSLYDDYNNYVDALTNSSKALSLSYADRKDIKELYLAKDRAALFDLLSPIFETLKEENNIRHLYIENTDGTVFLRVHNQEKYGDDITYRNTAATALSSQETVAGVEIGPSRIGIRSVSPLWLDNNFIGMVEVGLDYDQTFIDEFKERTGADFNLWLSYEAAKKSGLGPSENAHKPPSERLFHYASTDLDLAALPISSNLYETVLETNNPITSISFDENAEEIAVIIAPLRAYEGHAIGIVEILLPRTSALELVAENRRAVLLPAILLTLVGLVFLAFIINQVVLSPVNHLESVAKEQLAGNLDARIKNFPPDEFGTLGKTYNALSQQLDETLRNQEKVITERTKNIEERSTYLQSSAEISRQVASITSTDQLVNDVVARIQKGFNLYYVGLFLVDKSNEWAVLEAGTGEAGETMLANKHRLRIGEGMIGWCVQHAESRIALDVGEDAVRFENPVLPETRSEGALPLRSRGRVLGALTIQSTEPEAFTTEIITTLQTMADQIGIALDNAELLAQSEAALSAERKAYGHLSQEDWLALLLKKKAPSYISKGDALPVEANKEPVPTEDKQMLENNGLTAIIPIKIEGHILGGVRLQKGEEQGAWTKKELELAGVLIERPLSTALESARLFEQTQRRAAQERVVGESTARIRETLDIENVLETAAQELHKILGKVETEIWIDAE